jgi:beta-carotene 3-hydroxylase
MVPIFFIVISFLAMEAVAWISHRYIMHGLLWILHKDHHQKNQGVILEKNDLFFLLIAIHGIILIFFGTASGINTIFLWPGIGITLYGAAYFIVHDVFIHQRINFLKKADNFYLRAIRKAHKMHHKHLDRFDGECFGMLLVPWKYFKEALKQKR